jgi:sucrose phosphorylase
VTFFNFLASHDGIGLNPVRGILTDSEIDALVKRTLEHGGRISYKDGPDGSRAPYEMNINYLDALSNPAAKESLEWAAGKFLTAHAILLSLQGVPGLYFHSMFGSRGDRAGADVSGVPRRINREKPDRSQLEMELRNADSLRARVLGALRELLRVRGLHPAFAPLAPQRVLELDGRVFGVLRRSEAGGDRVLCLHNVSGGSVPVKLGELPATVRDGERLLGLAGNRLTGGQLTLEPWETVWLGRSGT